MVGRPAELIREASRVEDGDGAAETASVGILGRFVRGLLVVLVALAVVLAAGVLSGPGGIPWAVDVRPLPSALPPAAPPAPEQPRERPTPEQDPRTTPIAAPVPPPSAGGTHAFTRLQDDGVTPVRYDPCERVHFALNPRNAPAGAEPIVFAAVARIAEVTGLRFVYDGYTDESPSADRPAYQPERYGDRWAPVLIAWATEDELPALAGNVVGQAGSAAVSLGDRPQVYVTGTVALDAPQLGPILERRNGRDVVSAIVLHELGHLVGLAHVDDPGELMYPEVQDEVTAFSAGDLTGLARLGTGPCVPEL